MKSKKSNPDMDEQNEGVSYEKGREFEKKFAQFMKDELGWDKVRVGAHMPGRDNAKGTSIDVCGERLDELGMKYRQRSTPWAWGSIVLAVFSVIWWWNDLGENGIGFFIFSGTSFLASRIFIYLAELNHKKHAWVECKNLKGRVNINHISKMIRELKDFKASKNDEYKFNDLYFASSNGYVENALKMAMDNGIVCYTKKGRTFVEEKYWDETKK